MKREDLLRSIGSVDDRFVDELFAENAVVHIGKAAKMKGWRALAASLAIVVVGTAAMIAGFGGIDSGTTKITDNTKQLPMANNTVIMLDVNPSLKIEINDRNVVVDVNALNKDGEKIAADIDIVGKKYSAAVKVTVDTMKAKGYVSNLKNSILVSVLDKDEDRAEDVREKVVSAIKKIDKRLDYEFSILSQTMNSETKHKELAEKYKISSGRILFIDKICRDSADYDFKTLAANNIQTLNQLVEYIGIPDDVNIIGKAAAVVPDKYRDKVNLDDLNSDEVLKFTKAISDFYNKLTQYYTEKEVADQIGYVLDISEGENEVGEKLWAIIAESRNHFVGSQGAIINVGDEAVSNWYGQNDIDKVAKLVTGIIKKVA